MFLKDMKIKLNLPREGGEFRVEFSVNRKVRKGVLRSFSVVREET